MGASRLIPILLCAEGQSSKLASFANKAGWQTVDLASIAEGDAYQVAMVDVNATADALELRRRFPLSILVSCREIGTDEEVDFNIDLEKHDTFIWQLFEHAGCFWRKNLKVNELSHDVARRRQRMHQLNEISLALTGQMSQHDLLCTILSEARRIAGCEAGSLFLVEAASNQSESLVFKLSQNDAVEFPFVETSLPLSAESIAGYVATTGKELNIRDVYLLSTDLPYRFNRFFDDRMGYRTRSVLAIPMRDHRERVVGVLQFINRRSVSSGEVIAFGEETVEVLQAIASQAAVSIQKNALLEDINRLFEGFVQASVKTIEQRDPTTSGHSFRVAETTVALLEALPKSGIAEFSSVILSPEHIREVRYAALLHDFGKVGVPEAILIKAKKLTDERLEVLSYRFELQKERLRRRAIEQELELLHQAPVDQEVIRRRVHRQLEKQLSILDQYFTWVVNANDPHVLDAGEFGHLEEIRNYAFQELDGSMGGVIEDSDLLALSVRKGSLTPQERRVIESHVVYTTEFLTTLPWPPELAGVPDIAGAHHERMDGSGYPRGLVDEQIPLASRVMAVCDVYDALTAMDRPYKSAIPAATAFAILQDEAERGLLDSRMVDIFIDSGSYRFAATG